LDHYKNQYSQKIIMIMKKSVLLVVGILCISLTSMMAQNNGLNQRIPLIGSEVPAFKASSTTGEINFPQDFGENWKIVFSHPRNYTPVCSSEILELAYHQSDFTNLGAKLLVVSTDRVDRHLSWKAALEDISFNGRGKVSIDFPLVEDHTYKISNSFGMLDSETNVGQSVRGVFFVDPQNKIRAFYFYPNEVGRNVDEIKRTLIALQTNYNEKRAILPVNWQPGDDYMVQYLTDEETASIDTPESDIYKVSWFMNYKKNTGK
jgi:peroxiredoxin 2/4